MGPYGLEQICMAGGRDYSNWCKAPGSYLSRPNWMAALWKLKRCSWTTKTLCGLGRKTRAFTVFMVARWIIFLVLMVFPVTSCGGSMRIAKAICGLRRPTALIVSVTFELLPFQPAKDWPRQRWILFSPRRMALSG